MSFNLKWVFVLQTFTSYLVININLKPFFHRFKTYTTNVTPFYLSQRLMLVTLFQHCIQIAFTSISDLHVMNHACNVAVLFLNVISLISASLLTVYSQLLCKTNICPFKHLKDSTQSPRSSNSIYIVRQLSL